MSIQHTVRIHVAHPDGNLPVVKSGIRHIPRRLIRFLFGDCAEVLVLKPGETVKTVEIKEVKGEANHETVRS
uniref:Uncharacterized protein n=1 Tax=uncultured bacterium Contig160 TaxID=1393469 RepID=W0FHL7_9BACT|nr:hypothetical protein [uncultured bacterium Contig160]